MTNQSDRKLAFGLFVLTFVACGYFFGGGGWAQNSHFDLTRAIVERGTFEITGLHENTGDVAWAGGRAYSNKSPGLSLAAAPVYAVIHGAESALGLDPTAPLVLTLNLYLCTLVLCAGSAAAIPALLYSYARRELQVERRAALFIALVVAVASPLLPWSTVFFLHLPNALALLLAFLCAVRGRPFQSALAAGCAALLNYLCLPLIVIFGILAVLRHPRRRAAALMFSAGAAGPLLLLAFYQYAAFGELLRNPVTTNQRFVSEDAIFGFVKVPDLDALAGITISPYRGLFYLAPVLILGIGGAIVMARDRARRPEFFAILATVGLFFGFNVTFNNWEGGFGIGPRYVVATIPFIGIWLFYARSLWRWLWIGTAVVSLVNVFAATAVDPQPSGSIPRPLSQYIYPLLIHGEFSADVPITPPWSAETVRGHVAVNPHTPDQYKPFMLHPPGSAESEWASFNLGEAVFGQGSLLSLLPIAIWMGVGALLLFRKALAP